jgi:hypothetical protein
LHLSLLSSFPTMRVLDARQPPALSDAIAAQFIRHYHPRHIWRAFKQPVEGALCSFGIAPRLNEAIVQPLASV